MKFDTRSEELFAAICDRQGYQLDKLATRSEQGPEDCGFFGADAAGAHYR
jgi:hypothetical protein